MARGKIRRTQALTKVPLFVDYSVEAIESILKVTTYSKTKKGTVLCHQGDAAHELYIIVSGECSVSVHEQGKDGENVQRNVGTLKELDYFGESALLGGSGGGGGGGSEAMQQQERQIPTRNATVTVDSDYLQLLMLSWCHFEQLIKQGILKNDVVSIVAKESERRKRITRDSFLLPKPLPTTQNSDAVLNSRSLYS